MKVVAGMSTQAKPSRSVKIVPGLAGFGWIRYKSACVISVGGPGKILSREPKDLRSSFWYQMFARESDDNPVKEFFLICTVFTQFEKT